jgi:hypothetical protein
MTTLKLAARGDETAAPAGPEQLAAWRREAAGLLNPASDIANDYLNHFNEILLLIENFPILLPEMVDEILTWRPKTYQTYFRESPLPGGEAAVLIYEHIDPSVRRRFEAVIAQVNQIAEKSVNTISQKRDEHGELTSEHVEEFCLLASKRLRLWLSAAADLVNHGKATPGEASQQIADRLLSNII